MRRFCRIKGLERSALRRFPVGLATFSGSDGVEARQIGGVYGAGFVHQAGAVIGDGLDGDFEFKGDLLVGLALDNSFEQLGFALREGVKTLANGIVVGSVAVHGEAGVDTALDGVDEDGGFDGLLEEIDGAQLHATYRCGDVGMTADEDDGGIDHFGAEPLEKLDAADSGHADIEDDAGGDFEVGIGEEFLSGFVGAHGQGCRLDQHRQAFTHAGVVIDDVDNYACFS